MGPEELSCGFEEVGIGGGGMVRLGEGGELGMRIAWLVGGEGSRGEERGGEVAVGGGLGHGGRSDPLRIRAGGVWSEVASWLCRLSSMIHRFGRRNNQLKVRNILCGITGKATWCHGVVFYCDSVTKLDLFSNLIFFFTC